MWSPNLSRLNSAVKRHLTLNLLVHFNFLRQEVSNMKLIVFYFLLPFGLSIKRILLKEEFIYSDINLYLFILIISLSDVIFTILHFIYFL